MARRAVAVNLDPSERCWVAGLDDAVESDAGCLKDAPEHPPVRVRRQPADGQRTAPEATECAGCIERAATDMGRRVSTGLQDQVQKGLADDSDHLAPFCRAGVAGNAAVKVSVNALHSVHLA
jgi:hypothetical protein